MNSDQATSVQALIADDHPLFRAALKQAIEQTFPNCNVIEAQDFAQVCAMTQAHPELELIFLDLNMPGNEGFTGLSQLRNRYPDVLIIMVSASEKADVMHRAIHLGASAFIPKSAPLADITTAIEHVLNGEVWLPAQINTPDMESCATQALADKLDSLSPAQFRVLQLIADGMLNKQIAYELDIRETTVKQHVSAVLSKLGVYNRTQAGLLFQQLRQID